MSLSTFRCLLLLSVSTLVFLHAFLSFSFLLLFRAHLRLASSTRFASGPFVHPFLFQPFSFVFSRVLFSLSFLLPPPLCCSLLLSLSFHSGFFSPLTRARSPAARASEVFLNRSTTGGCYRAALFSSHAPKSLERRDWSKKLNPSEDLNR